VLGATEIDEGMLEQTINVLVKDRKDIETAMVHLRT
jgi:hypothetical protein